MNHRLDDVEAVPDVVPEMSEEEQEKMLATLYGEYLSLTESERELAKAS